MVKHSFWSKYGLYIFLLCFGLLILFVLVFEPALPLMNKKKKGLPDFFFEGVVISQIDDGQLKWEIRSDKASIYKGKDQVDLINVDGNLFEKDESVVLFKSDGASLTIDSSDLNMNEVNATFNVQGKPYRLKSDTLNYESSIDRFIGKGNLVLKSHLLTVEGDYFQVELPVKRLLISNDARAKIYNQDMR